jgi:ADP-ribose pyrophosphatase YjhB (NUDIX family)
LLIPEAQYQGIIRILPILCVDVVITTPQGRYLLVKRSQPPLLGEWWVVGGRVLHGESMEAAVHRKSREEAGISVCSIKFIGYYEDLYKMGFPYHTVSVVFTAEMLGDCEIKLDKTSSEWKFSDELPARLKIKLC